MATSEEYIPDQAQAEQSGLTDWMHRAMSAGSKALALVSCTLALAPATAAAKSSGTATETQAVVADVPHGAYGYALLTDAWGDYLDTLPTGSEFDEENVSRSGTEAEGIAQIPEADGEIISQCGDTLATNLEHLRTIKLRRGAERCSGLTLYDLANPFPSLAINSNALPHNLLDGTFDPLGSAPGCDGVMYGVFALGALIPQNAPKTHIGQLLNPLPDKLGAKFFFYRDAAPAKLAIRARNAAGVWGNFEPDCETGAPFEDISTMEAVTGGTVAQDSGP